MFIHMCTQYVMCASITLQIRYSACMCMHELCFLCDSLTISYSVAIMHLLAKVSIQKVTTRCTWVVWFNILSCVIQYTECTSCVVQYTELCDSVY